MSGPPSSWTEAELEHWWREFGEGFDAFKTGDICPYPYQSASAWRWREGHREAERRQRERQCLPEDK